METDILVLGGGFGGLEVATSLKKKLGGEYRITLVDRKDYFIVGFTKFDIMFGRKEPSEIKNFLPGLKNQGIEFLRETVLRIDPVSNTIKTENLEIQYKYLIISLGVELHPEAVPGFSEGGYSFYDLPEAQRLKPVLESFSSGTILVSILDNPYQCPPAPYEAALQLHDYYKEKGHRGNITIRVLAPSPVPIPLSKNVSASILELLDGHNIEFLPRHKVIRLDNINKQAVIEGFPAMDYDLFLGIPVHRPPKVILDSVLGKDGWIRVDVRNFRTEFDNIYAIGDVTHIPVGGFAVPKTGAFAEEAGKAVVADILNRLRGENNKVEFMAAGACYLEMGSGKIAVIETNFLGGDEPVMKFTGPSEIYRPDKEEFASSRINKWFRKP